VRRFLFAQYDCLYGEDNHMKLVEDCVRWGITDVVVGDLTPEVDLVDKLRATGIRIFVWWAVGYWPAGGLEWYDNAPSSWKLRTNSECKLNAGRADVQSAIAAYAVGLAQRDDIDGVLLDYFRYQDGAAKRNSFLSADDWTNAITSIRTALGDRELVLAGVPYDAGGYPGYNFDMAGCSQPWDGWLEEGLLDIVLAMEYWDAVGLTEMLPNYDGIAQSGLIACPIAFYEESRLLSADEFASILAMLAEREMMGIFDYASLMSNPQHAALLEGSGGDEPEPDQLMELVSRIAELVGKFRDTYTELVIAIAQLSEIVGVK